MRAYVLVLRRNIRQLPNQIFFNLIRFSLNLKELSTLRQLERIKSIYQSKEGSYMKHCRSFCAFTECEVFMPSFSNHSTKRCYKLTLVPFLIHPKKLIRIKKAKLKRLEKDVSVKSSKGLHFCRFKTVHCWPVIISKPVKFLNYGVWLKLWTPYRFQNFSIFCTVVNCGGSHFSCSA